MNREQFKKLPNFTYQEMYDHFRSKGFSDFGAKQEISKVSFDLMAKVQKLRTAIGRPIFFNCLTEGKHTKGSSHYLGQALDFRVGGKGKVNFNKVLQLIIEVGFKGVGWYPFWNTPGFHVDIRKGTFKCWTRDKDGKYYGLI